MRRCYMGFQSEGPEMIETHDLFLRAIAVPVEKKKKKKTRITVVDEPKWPNTILAFDTESRTTLDQSLTFGVWRRCKLVGQKYEVVEEGIFYSDDLSAKDIEVLKTYMKTAVPDVASFP